MWIWMLYMWKSLHWCLFWKSLHWCLFISRHRKFHATQLLVLPKDSAALLSGSSVLETINLYSSASLCKTVQIEQLKEYGNTEKFTSHLLSWGWDSDFMFWVPFNLVYIWLMLVSHFWWEFSLFLTLQDRETFCSSYHWFRSTVEDRSEEIIFLVFRIALC